MRRRRLLVAIIAAAFVVTMVALYSLPSSDRITHANYERIDEGMTPAEVEALLGPSRHAFPDLYSDEFSQRGYESPVWVQEQTVDGDCYFPGSKASIVVSFSPAGRALSKHWFPRVGAFQRMIGRLRDEFDD